MFNYNWQYNLGHFSGEEPIHCYLSYIQDTRYCWLIIKLVVLTPFPQCQCWCIVCTIFLESFLLLLNIETEGAGVQPWKQELKMHFSSASNLSASENKWAWKKLLKLYRLPTHRFSLRHFCQSKKLVSEPPIRAKSCGDRWHAIYLKASMSGSCFDDRWHVSLVKASLSCSCCGDRWHVILVKASLSGSCCGVRWHVFSINATLYGLPLPSSYLPSYPSHSPSPAPSCSKIIVRT